MTKATSSTPRDSGPRSFLRVAFAKHRGEDWIGIARLRHGIEALTKNQRAREISKSTVAVTETTRPRTGELTQPHVPETEPGESVEAIELPDAREVALDNPAWH